MPPQQSCCCQDGEEPCPNCYENAAFGCSPPCCWCSQIEPYCEGDLSYTLGLQNCHTDWEILPPYLSPCSDTFNVNVQIPDEIEVNIGPFASQTPGEAGFPTESVHLPVETLGDAVFSSPVLCTNVTWIVNSTSGKGPVGTAAFRKRGDGSAPFYLPDNTHVGRACPAVGSASCDAVPDTDSCSGNDGYCCRDCDGEGTGIDPCSYASPYRSGYFLHKTDFETETTLFWNKQVQDVDITVSMDTRSTSTGGCSPCCYFGESSEVAIGEIKYLGLRNMVSSHPFLDPNCPTNGCNCDNSECSECVHCTDGACLNCLDVRCKNDDPEIDWSDVQNLADFDVYTVPVSWKLHYELRAMNFDSNLSDEKYHWQQNIWAVLTEDWTGITVDPDTQQLKRAAVPPFEYKFTASPLDRDCYNCSDPDEVCEDCNCSGCAFQEMFQTGHILRGLIAARPTEDLSRCDYARVSGNANVCGSEDLNCGSNGGKKKYVGEAQTWLLNPEQASVDWSVPWVYYVYDNRCDKVATGTTTAYFSMYHRGTISGSPDFEGDTKFRWAVNVGPRIESCSQSCPTCEDDGGVIDCSWEDGGFVVTITGLDP